MPPHPQSHPHPPTAPWRTPTHLRTLGAQIAATPPSPLPSLLHLTLHAILPFLLFTTFVIAGTIVLVYTLSLSKPVPARFAIGATVAFAVLGLGAGGVWVGVRVARAQGRMGDGEARLTGGGAGSWALGWKGEGGGEGAADVRQPAAAATAELAQSAEQGRACAQETARGNVRDSHELHAPSPQQRKPGPLREETPASVRHEGTFLREGTPCLDRYPRCASVPLSLSSGRTSLQQAGLNAPAMAWHQQDSGCQVGAAAKASSRRDSFYRVETGAGTSPPEGVPVLSLPNKLRKAKGLGMGVGKGARRSGGWGEVVLESVERNGLGEGVEGFGKGKVIEPGYWENMKLAEIEGNVQRMMFLMHAKEGRV